MNLEKYQKVIDGSGPHKCFMAIVGEAPGDVEVATGEPFMGPSGNQLNMKLHRAGVARGQCYITNIHKTALPGNDFSVLWNGKHPTPALIQDRDNLLMELDQLDTVLVLALGANPLWALTGKTGLGKWRGSTLYCDLPSGKRLPVIATYHPSAIFKQYPLNYLLELDIKKAARIVRGADFLPRDRNLIIDPSKAQVENWCHHVTDQDISFDIETSPTQITCMGLSVHPDEAISIPTTKYHWGSMHTLKDILMAVEYALSGTGKKVAHNMGFDLQYMIRYWHILPKKPWLDTMVAWHCLQPESGGKEDPWGKKKSLKAIPKSLAFLTSVFTNEPYYKDDLKIWQTGSTVEGKTNNELLWTYNARDAATTIEIAPQLHSLCKDYGVLPLLEFRHEVLEIFLYMMLSGFNVDKELAARFKSDLEADVERRESILNESIGAFNPRSPKQVKAVLENLGFTDVQDTSKKTIEKLAKKNPMLQEVIDVRHDKKLLSTNMKMATDPTDGRFRFSINVCGTETGRGSSNESVFGYGFNMQNVPLKLRSMWIPDSPDMEFTEVDLKGAEAMYVAYDSQDTHLIKLFEQGGNIHRFTANMIWGATDEEIIAERKQHIEETGDETKSMYYKAKRVRHSGNYLGTHVTLSEQLAIPQSEAKALLHRFYQMSPALQSWQQHIKEEVTRTKELKTFFGMRRKFHDRIGPDLYRAAVAFIPQAAIVHIINAGMAKVYKNLCSTNPGISIKLQVHDSILLQHPKKLRRMVHGVLPILMRYDITLHGRTFYIPIEMKVGDNWGKMKEVKQ